MIRQDFTHISRVPFWQSASTVVDVEVVEVVAVVVVIGVVVVVVVVAVIGVVVAARITCRQKSLNRTNFMIVCRCTVEYCPW